MAIRTSSTGRRSLMRLHRMALQSLRNRLRPARDHTPPPGLPMKFLYSPLQRLVMMTTVLLLVGGCASTTEGGAVHAERRQLLLISSAELEKSAAKGYAQLQAEAVKKGTLNTDPALTQRVRMIVRRMQPLTGVFRADAPGWKWEVNVISSDELNAFCMPGGKIAFYSGLIKQLNLSDDEIAIVMGHEIAHALREGCRQRRARDKPHLLLLRTVRARGGCW